MADEPLALGGDDSPWAHDLPIADPAPLPTTWAPAAPVGGRMVDVREARWGRPADRDAPADVPADAPVDAAPGTTRLPGVLDPLAGSPPAPDAPTPGHQHRRSALVIGLVGLLAAAVVGSQLAQGDDDPTSDDEAATVTSTVPDTDTAPSAPTTAPVIKVQIPERFVPTTTLADRLPEPPPEWVTSTVALDPRVAAIPATRLAALRRDGTLYVIDTSTGATDSIATGNSGMNVTLSLRADDVLLSSYERDYVTLARVGVPPVRVDVDGGVSRVIEGGGDDSILVPNVWNPESPEVLRLGSDAQPVAVSSGPLVQFDPWQIEFLPATGRMIVNDTGGVYLVDDSGAATRVSTGDLVFNGPNHFVVRECDEALVCTYVRVDQVTGQRDIVDLSPLDEYRYGDPSSSSLSPDGTALSYFDWMNGGALPARRLFDLATGADVKVVSADQYNVETAWAADSSGLFVVVGRTIMFYDRATGQQIPVAPDSGLEDIVAVATRPITG